MTDSPDHPYQSASKGTTLTTVITSQAFDLADCPDPTLTFRYDADLMPMDSVHVELTNDGGDTWRPLSVYEGQSVLVLNSATTDEWRDIIWKSEAITLSQFIPPVNTGQAQLRFSMTVDDENSGRGWIVDDIAVDAGSARMAANDFSAALVKPLENIKVVFLPLISQ